LTEDVGQAKDYAAKLATPATSCSGCIVLGYPELKPFAPDFWTRFWRAYSYLNKNGLIRLTES